MRRIVVVLCLLITVAAACLAQTPHGNGWHDKLAEELPLLGHRNWILIVDSAYPLEVAPGVETIETNAPQLLVLHSVLDEINRSIHVRPDIFMDAELPYVQDTDAPGVSGYRSDVATILRGNTVQSRPHAQLLDMVARDGQQYHILVLKTRMAIPYTSIFLRLNCRYWSDDAEARLRKAMSAR